MIFLMKGLNIRYFLNFQNGYVENRWEQTPLNATAEFGGDTKTETLSAVVTGKKRTWLRW